MAEWQITEEGFHPERITADGNKFFTGNGYLGVRGTLPEYEKEQFPAINLSGIYDQVGDAWREPLNAPNGLYTCLKYNEIEYRLPEVLPDYHKMSLNYRHGVLSRETAWNTPGGRIRIFMERFASMKEKHLIVMQYRILTEADGMITFQTGIDGEVWDINGPHYDGIKYEEVDGILTARAITHENKDSVYVCEICRTDIPLQKKKAEKDKEFHKENQKSAEVKMKLLIENQKSADVGMKLLGEEEKSSGGDQKLLRGNNKFLREFTFQAEAGHTYTIIKWISVYTNRDTADYKELGLELVKRQATAGYQAALNLQIAEWEKLWSCSEVLIEGDPAAMEALNYSIYHLQSIAPRHTDSLSIPARGLSGQTYKGAVFWDTELFMLDLFLNTDPSVAKSLLKYRIDTLPGAITKARHYGCKGAFYAWESQEGGYDACSDYNVVDVFTGRPMRTYFKDKQIHISSAVVYGIMKYTDATGNLDLLEEGGTEVILQCAAFYHDLLLQRIGLSHYELHDVIGPDEYHERVNNNAYTNRMAKFTFESAIRTLRLLKENKLHRALNPDGIEDPDELLYRFQDAADHLYIPEPERDTSVIEQFDGYFTLEDVTLETLRKRILNEKEYWGGANGIAAHTQIIKQADVVTMLNLFSGDYSREILNKNWEYYEPRTEHGSSLSACMYAILACKCNMPDIAYPLFIKSASADLKGEGKEWAGLIYIGGTHPAAAGGAYKTVLEGFAGLTEENGALVAEPRLPSHWSRLSFKIIYRGVRCLVNVMKDRAEITRLT